MVIDGSRHYYRWLIVFLLTTFLLFSFWAARRATVQGSAVSDADYYGKGLRYSDTRAEEQAAAVLGWQISTSLRQQRLSLQLFDRNRLPVSNAAGTVSRISPSHTGANPFPMQEGPIGTYQISLPSEWHGETVLNLEFSHEGARFSRRLLLNL